MKRIIAILIVMIFVISGCRKVNEIDKKAPDSKISGVWLTYSEINELLEGGQFKENFFVVSSNLERYGITDVFIQVRPFCDSLFKSEYFPQNELSLQYDFDVFSYMIDTLHKNNIRIHAWLNPYRVRTADSDINNLPSDSPAYKWLTDDVTENDNNICILNGIYLNPASSDVKKLITDGVREIINNYDVDGVHIDDYFYPTTSSDFDAASYEDYKSKNENPLSLDEYRISHINALISSLYTAIKFKDKNLIFSISPSASISKNKQEYYADIKTWVKNECVDIIIPQAYFGFDYPDKDYRFDKIIDDYKALPFKSTKLVIGLATYKIGTSANPDNIEWKDGEKIIDKQVEICEKDKKISGFVFFSYSSFLSYKEQKTPAG